MASTRFTDEGKQYPVGNVIDEIVPLDSNTR
jgi:hypothetical protein